MLGQTSLFQYAKTVTKTSTRVTLKFLDYVMSSNFREARPTCRRRLQSSWSTSPQSPGP